MAKKYWLNVVEYGVMNKEWDGWRMARIEVHKEGEHYAIDEGFIRLPDALFIKVREALDLKSFDRLPYIRLDTRDKEDLNND